MEYFNFRPESIKAVKEGKEAVEQKTSKTTGTTVYYMFVPIHIGASNSPWSLVINIPLDFLRERARS